MWRSCQSATARPRVKAEAAGSGSADGAGEGGAGGATTAEALKARQAKAAVSVARIISSLFLAPLRALAVFRVVLPICRKLGKFQRRWMTNLVMPMSCAPDHPR